ncbi:copper homeostasis CutC domain-containing protein [Russula emetica]|nr:copper homeostasis CutC domain-containing protein [Russula emetica]
MSSQNLVLEVCVDSVQSAISAQRGGADRLEVCGNLGIGGGTTPSLGLVRAIQKALPHIPIMAMIRPRAGDFFYSQEELDVMLEDIGLFKSVGIVGIVLGALNPDGTVDVPRTRMWIERPVTVCFHRAFDMTRGALLPAFDQICTIPSVARILTSGQSVSAPAGLHVLRELLQRSQKNGGPVILPGAGINPGTVHQVLENLLPYGLKEIHLSGGKWVEGQMAHRPVGMGMSASEEKEWKVWLTDEDTIREVRSVADRWQ